MSLTAVYIEPAGGHVLANTGPWRCFHCDELCETVEAATHHFGRHDGCTPICQVAAETYRAMEREVQSFRSESDADSVLFYSLGAKHSTALREAEQAGYDRGLADGRELRTQAPDSWRPIAEHDNSADEMLVMAEGWTKPIVAWRHHPSSRTDMWLTVPGKYQVKPTEFCPLPALRPQTAESGK